MLRRERSEIQPESGAAHSSNGDGAIMQNKSDVSDFTTNTFYTTVCSASVCWNVCDDANFTQLIIRFQTRTHTLSF